MLLVAYDLPYPQPLHAVRPFAQPFAVALLLAPEPRPGTLARCRIAVASGRTAATRFPGALRGELASNPAGRALPAALDACAAIGHEPVRLGYLDGCQLVVEPVEWP